MQGNDGMPKMLSYISRILTTVHQDAIVPLELILLSNACFGQDL